MNLAAHRYLMIQHEWAHYTRIPSLAREISELYRCKINVIRYSHVTYDYDVINPSACRRVHSTRAPLATASTLLLVLALREWTRLKRAGSRSCVPRCGRDTASAWALRRSSTTSSPSTKTCSFSRGRTCCWWWMEARWSINSRLYISIYSCGRLGV